MDVDFSDFTTTHGQILQAVEEGTENPHIRMRTPVWPI